MKRNDILLFLFLALLTGTLFLLRPAPQTDKAAVIRVTVDGKPYGAWQLKSARTIDVTTPYGKNKIVIKDGSAYISEADCPSRDCLKQKQVSRPGDIIVCLPHKLVIEGASAAGPNGVDTVAY